MKFIISLVTTLIVFAASGQDKGLAKVEKLQNRYVFFYNEPVAEYETAFSFKVEYPSDMTECPSIGNMAKYAIKSAIMESGYQNQSFDAIIIGTDERDVAIRFTDKANAEDLYLARVNRERGKYVFVFAEPAGDYEYVEDIFYSLQDNLLGGGCYGHNDVASSILVKAMRREGRKKSIKFDAVVYKDKAFSLLFE